MPKFKLLVDVDSVVDEAKHLEEIFKDGFDCSEEEAEKIVEAKVKELMYGGPYYHIVEDEDGEDPAVNNDKHQGREDVHSHLDEEEPASDDFFPDARDQHLIRQDLTKATGGK